LAAGQTVRPEEVLQVPLVQDWHPPLPLQAVLQQ